MSSTMGLILFICLSFSMLPGVQGLGGKYVSVNIDLIVAAEW